MPKNAEYTGGGRLLVRVRTADGALPVAGAAVTVTGADAQNAAVYYRQTTDESGNTPPIPLSAPPAADSLTPDNGGGRPFALYDVGVVLDGYYTHESRGVPVFDGVLSSLPVALLPLPRFDDGIPRPEIPLPPNGGQTLYNGQREENS
jgi:hypothetical protein